MPYIQRRAAARAALRTLTLAAALSALLPLAACQSGGPIAPAAAQTTKAAADEGEPAGSSPHARLREARPEPEGKLPPIDLTREILFQVLAAEVAVQRGQVGAAATTYLSLAQSTRDPRLARRATELALAERSLEHALSAARLWYQLAPENPTAVQTIEALWLATGRFDEAEPLVTQRLAKARGEGTLRAAYQQLQRTLARSTDKNAALGFIEKVSTPDQSLPEARLAVASLASAAGNPERAAAEATSALALRPDDERSAVSAAQYVRQTPLGAGGAGDLLKKFLGRQPKAAEARFAYAQLLASEGKTEDARGQMEIALKQEPESPSILFAMAQLAYQLKQPKVAQAYLKRYLALPRAVQRDDVPAWIFLAQIAEEAKRYDEAIGWLSRVTRGEQYLSALTRRALLMGRAKRVDEARELLRNTSVTSARERAMLSSAEAQVLREAQRHQEAYEVLAAAVERQPGNPDLLYDLGMAAEKLGNVPAMETNLRRVIALRPDYAHGYNALGYSLADRGLRLDEAQALIEKALALAPDDPHIIDSMGWVLYRKGQMEQAIEWLKKGYALKAEPEIAAHLGEVLWKAGRSAEAREMWRAAQKLDPDNETLKETLARLNVAL